MNSECEANLFLFVDIDEAIVHIHILLERT